MTTSEWNKGQSDIYVFEVHPKRNPICVLHAMLEARDSKTRGPFTPAQIEEAMRRIPCMAALLN